MSHSSHAHADHEPTITAEPDHVDVAAVFRFAIGLAVITILAHILMYFTWHAGVAAVDASNPPPKYPLAVATQDTRRPPLPRLQDGVQNDNGGRLLQPTDMPDRNLGVREALKSLREEEQQILTGYSWVDRNRQIVRIPIADAMKLTLQRGLPSRQQTSTEPAADTAPATQAPR